MKCAFVFVCQGGKLELQAALLAASLVRYVKCDAEIIAAIPRYAGVQEPSQTVIDLLVKLDIRLEYITNELDKSYPIANKIMCFNIPVNADYFIFLDSDILLLRELHEDFFVPGYDLAARLTDFSDLTQDDWTAIYEYCDAGKPAFDKCAMVTGDAMPLSLNSGVVISTEPANLYKTWMATARKLNQPDRFPKTRPFLDQIALSLLVNQSGLQYYLMDQHQHFSLPIYLLDVLRPPYFVHYYENLHLVGDTLLSTFVQSLLKEHESLVDILKNDPMLALL